METEKLHCLLLLLSQEDLKGTSKIFLRRETALENTPEYKYLSAKSAAAGKNNEPSR